MAARCSRRSSGSCNKLKLREIAYTVGEIRVRLGSTTRILKMASTGRGGSSRTRQSSFAFRLINPELFIKPVSTLSFLSQTCRQFTFHYLTSSVNTLEALVSGHSSHSKKGVCSWLRTRMILVRWSHSKRACPDEESLGRL